MSITLVQASIVVDEALRKGREIDCAPLTVVVTDAGGHVVACKREDGSGILRFDIAYGKAWGALGMGYGTRELANRAVSNPAFFAALAAASGGRVVPSPGGVLILDDETVFGAVGISGDTGDRDEECALAGIIAAGFAGQTGT